MEQKEIKCFSDWWEVNKERYERIGVNQLVACSIWNDAADCMSEMFKRLIEKL